MALIVGQADRHLDEMPYARFKQRPRSVKNKQQTIKYVFFEEGHCRFYSYSTHILDPMALVSDE